MTIKNSTIPKTPLNSLKKKVGYFFWVMSLKPMERTINEVLKKRDINEGKKQP